MGNAKRLTGCPAACDHLLHDQTLLISSNHPDPDARFSYEQLDRTVALHHDGQTFELRPLRWLGVAARPARAPTETLTDWRPTEVSVRRALRLIVAEAPEPTRIGLLALKLLEGRRRGKNVAAAVESFLGRRLSEAELLSAAVSARRWVNEQLLEHFECGPSWQARWIPPISA